MKRYLLLLLGLAGMSFAYVGCTKEPLNNLSAEESRIYITDHDSSVNFSDYKTFSISDSVAVIDNGNVKKQLSDVDAAYISAVIKYMENDGYTLVSKDEKPDVGVDVNRIISTSTGIISYGDYWGYYDSYWDPYYWGFPGYNYYLPYAYSIYQIKQGAISVDMLDLKNAPDKKKINIVWTGLIRGSGIFNAAVADSQVKALFDQSPYLTTN